MPYYWICPYWRGQPGSPEKNVTAKTTKRRMTSMMEMKITVEAPDLAASILKLAGGHCLPAGPQHLDPG